LWRRWRGGAAGADDRGLDCRATAAEFGADAAPKLAVFAAAGAGAESRQFPLPLARFGSVLRVRKEPEEGLDGSDVALAAQALPQLAVGDKAGRIIDGRHIDLHAAFGFAAVSILDEIAQRASVTTVPDSGK